MTVLIRRAGAGEARTLREIRLAALEDSPSAFGSTYAAEAQLRDEDWDARARRGSAGSDRTTFFAAIEGHVVGLVGGFRGHGPDDSIVEVVSMWTAPPARRSGVGRLLVEAVLDWADATGAVAAELWVTRGNEAAQALYESTGFRETGDHQPLPSDPCKDEIRMRCGLRDPAEARAILTDAVGEPHDPGLFMTPMESFKELGRAALDGLPPTT
jgi:GNAT superfamily N-acetyltransferase